LEILPLSTTVNEIVAQTIDISLGILSSTTMDNFAIVFNSRAKMSSTSTNTTDAVSKNDPHVNEAEDSQFTLTPAHIWTCYSEQETDGVEIDWTTACMCWHKSTDCQEYKSVSTVAPQTGILDIVTITHH
jgi:hypothetical protein